MTKNKGEYDWKEEIDWYVEEYVKRLPDVDINQMTAEAVARVIFRNLLTRYAKEEDECWTKQEFFRDELNSLKKVPIIAKDRERALKMAAQRVIKVYVDAGYLIRPMRKGKTGKGKGGTSPVFLLNLEKFEEIERGRGKDKYYSPRLSPLFEKLKKEKEFENGEWDYEVPVDGKRIDAVCIKNGIHSIIEENEKLNWDTYGEVDGKAILYSKQKNIERSNIKRAIVVKYGDDSIEKACEERDIVVFEYNR